VTQEAVSKLWQPQRAASTTSYGHWENPLVAAGLCACSVGFETASRACGAFSRKEMASVAGVMLQMERLMQIVDARRQALGQMKEDIDGYTNIAQGTVAVAGWNPEMARERVEGAAAQLGHQPASQP